MSYALVTGASSGIGKHIAEILYKKGYSLILTARNESALEALKTELKNESKNKDIRVFSCDLSDRESCLKLIDYASEFDVEVLINSAGFGVFGDALSSDINNELSMIDVNITAMHILCKHYLKEFSSKDKGYILNVSSFAGFMPGPLFASYYASKAYVLRYTQSVQYELKKSRSRVCLSALCPGPVKTGFDKRAGVEFAMDGLDAQKVAMYAVKKMFSGSRIIIPGAFSKIGRFFTKLLPDSMLCALGYKFQSKKQGR